MQTVKDFFKKYKRWIGIVVCAFVLIFLNYEWYINNKLLTDKKLEVANHNIRALEDTILATRDRADKVEYVKLAFLTDRVDNLSKLSTDLAKEIKNIKGNVQTIVKGSVEIVEKPVPFIVRGELLDSNVTAYFNYDSTYSPGNYRKLAGYTKYNLKDGTTVAKKEVDQIGMTFSTGIKDLDKGKPTIFFKSPYPGLDLTHIDGAVLDPNLFKPKRRKPLITGTVGISYVPLTYDWVTSKTDLNLHRLGVSGTVGLNIGRLFEKK